MPAGWNIQPNIHVSMDGVHIVSELKSVSISVWLVFFVLGECARESESSKFCEVPKV